MGNEQTQNRAQHAPSLPSNARLMNTAIKQRLQKGNTKSTYNMKVVIRGDRQTGKSALFHRLEGGGFIKEHRTTEQIQCSHVLWPYKTSDEMVNLEIWDVVDKAIIPTNIADDPNGVTPSIVSKNLLPADASTIDVYKGAHAIIFMVDPTRKWTLDYVKNNISLIPQGIDCVILFGKKDLHSLWTLTDNEIDSFMCIQPKNVRSLQISLQDCYGMKELHSFFNVPFLRMKAKYLQQELTRAQREYEQSKVELDIFINHQNYEQFLSRLKAVKENKNKRKKIAPPASALPARKVKQTVHSSKDLPLIQEQNLKEAKKKEDAEKKQADKKKQSDTNHTIDTFKPMGGLDDDFFADLGDHEDGEEDEQEGTTQSSMNGHDVDGQDEEQIGFDVDHEDDKTEHIKNGEGSEVNTIEANGNAQQHVNGIHMKPKTPVMNTNEKYSRMPDLKMNTNGGKLQALMKLQDASIASTDSSEYDDEPLVLATVKTPIERDVDKQTKSPVITPVAPVLVPKKKEPIVIDIETATGN
eukprot:202044_1